MKLSNMFLKTPFVHPPTGLFRRTKSFQGQHHFLNGLFFFPGGSSGIDGGGGGGGGGTGGGRREEEEQVKTEPSPRGEEQKLRAQPKDKGTYKFEGEAHDLQDI